MVCFALPRASDPAGRVRVWDLPTRLCHWALAVCVAGAFVTQAVEAMAWHGRFGLAILGLVVFRIFWGFFGSTYARFATFVRGPGAIRAYLQAAKAGAWRGFGHNPLGALSVLALLAILATMAATGIFANDDVSFTGRCSTSSARTCPTASRTCMNSARSCCWPWSASISRPSPSTCG